MLRISPMSDDENLKRILVEDIQRKVETLLQAESVSEEDKIQLIDEALRVFEKDKVKGIIQSEQLLPNHPQLVLQAWQMLRRKVIKSQTQLVS